CSRQSHASASVSTPLLAPSTPQMILFQQKSQAVKLHSQRLWREAPHIRHTRLSSDKGPRVHGAPLGMSWSDWKTVQTSVAQRAEPYRDSPFQKTPLDLQLFQHCLRNQALSLACAFASPFPVSMSNTGI